MLFLVLIKVRIRTTRGTRRIVTSQNSSANRATMVVCCHSYATAPTNRTTRRVTRRFIDRGVTTVAIITAATKSTGETGRSAGIRRPKTGIRVGSTGGTSSDTIDRSTWNPRTQRKTANPRANHNSIIRLFT